MATFLDRRGLHRIAVAAGAAFVLGPGLALAGDDGEVPLAKVPDVVRKAADKAVAGAKWSAAYMDRDDDGAVVYELDGTDPKGRDVIVEITAAGKMKEIETEIPIPDIPAGVQQALKAKMPRFKATAAFEVSRGGKVAGYSFEGRRPRDKEDIDVFVSADGKLVEIEE